MNRVEEERFHKFLLESDSLGCLKPFVPGLSQKPRHRRFFSQTEAEFAAAIKKPEEGKSIVCLPKLSRGDSTQQITYKESLNKLRSSMKSSRQNMFQYLQKSAQSSPKTKHLPLLTPFKRNMLEPSPMPKVHHRRALSLHFKEPERKLVIYSKFNKKPRAIINDSETLKGKLRAEKAKQLEQRRQMLRTLYSTMQLFD